MEDLKEIKQYIKYSLQEPETAKKMIGKIKKEIDKLKESPKIYSTLSDEFIKELKIRKIIVKNYIIFYRIQNDTVQIIRIIYDRRNWIKLL